MEKPRHSGRCLCGNVTFEIVSEPLWVAYCHCASCRRHTASPVACFAGFEERNVRFPKDKPASHESSEGTWRSFCRTCGSPVSYRSQRFPGEVHFYTGVMDAPERYRPTGHVNFEEHIAWFDTRDDLERHAATSKA
jgi:hypothetical protein